MLRFLARVTVHGCPEHLGLLLRTAGTAPGKNAAAVIWQMKAAKNGTPVWI